MVSGGKSDCFYGLLIVLKYIINTVVFLFFQRVMPMGGTEKIEDVHYISRFVLTQNSTP